ncbi:MAG TPA: phosphotransferase [Nocardioides sp.]|nr:phosphotransferase [Nocardioides sp.]
MDEDFDDGWDMSARLVDGRWVDRSPRRPDVEPQVRREVAVMPWLAPQLPLPVPVPQIVCEQPLTVRHAYVPGGPCPGRSAGQGRAVGAFLRALHRVDPRAAVAHGARDAEASFVAAEEIRHGLARVVLPRLPRHVLPAAEALLARLTTPPHVPRVTHGDLGPSHIRVTADRVTGVIDWGDCCVGDPALDLAWTVVGSAPAFGDAVVAAYGADDSLIARARDFHQLGPWHEVSHGLVTGRPAYVDSGVAGVVDRLERFGSS